MLKVGLTGGIGSGKSFVARIFSELGAPIYQADFEAKKLIEVDPDIVAAYKQFFGDEIYTPLGLNRKQVAALVFGDREILEKVNKVVHPAVERHFQSWLQQQSLFPYVIHEAAILIESGASETMDKLVVVVAPEEVRVARVIERDGVGPEQVHLRMAHQLSDQERIARADFVINNDNNQLLLPQVVELHEKLLSLSNKR
ncbi:MAG TPA: dephospho-CoA kinase [Williamwhitmania sp.]|nr:dephospho-CoA kinase [Williamwhitmania sp.]